MASPADIFDQNQPQIAERDAFAAAQNGRIVQSFNCHPIASPEGKISALAVKWKFSSGTTDTILIGPDAALILRMIFSHLEANKWTELAVLPPDATRQ
jgi:hypothetical protein